MLAVTSVLIAALTALSSFCRWERTWHGRATAKLAIQNLCGKWELELANARLNVPAEAKVDHVYKATNDLLTNFATVSMSEAEEFFSQLQFPRSDTTKPLDPVQPRS